NDTNVDTNAYANGSHNSHASRISSQHVVPWQRRRTLHVVARVPDEVLPVPPLLPHLTFSSPSWPPFLVQIPPPGRAEEPPKRLTPTMPETGAAGRVWRSALWRAFPRQALLPGGWPVDGFEKGIHGSLCVASPYGTYGGAKRAIPDHQANEL